MVWDLSWLERLLWGNPLGDWGYALGLALTINVVFAVLKALIVGPLARRASRSATPVDDAIVAMARHTRQFLIFGVTLLVGVQYLSLDPLIEVYFQRIATVAGFLQLGLWLSGALSFWIRRVQRRRGAQDATLATSLSAIQFIARLLLWTLVVLLMLDNLGVDVTALVAGLGVGGIAVALAVQNILGDLFASLSIVMDRPFVVGDFIEVDQFVGTVEHVGLKTTRLRSNTGEQIIIANSDLLKTRIRNYKRMDERRVLFRFGVVYQTPPAQLQAIPELVRSIIEAHPDTRFERTHFVAFGGSSLDFEVVYWMRNPDFLCFRDAHQQVSLTLFERFLKEGIEFAYPTQTLFMQPAPEVRHDGAAGGPAPKS